ncbi:phage minor capsid protein [Microbacterium sp. A8/3-1]|uniref:Phage minor capsid protein n=1 Tax=Microbacterium sp. A8/3-1 TaxID=3160749 RepID=A0AAU7VZM5_9MICO
MALFIPNPERESVEELIEDLSRYLAQRYRDAEDELIREVAKRAVRDFRLASLLPTAPGGMGMTAADRRARNRVLAELNAHRATAARELQAIAMQMVSDLRREDLANRVVALAAAEGEAAAAASLRFAGLSTITPIPGTASQAVAMVALSLESRLEVLNQRLTRYPQDAYQRIVSLYSPNTLLGITTSRIQQASAVQRFLSEGITGFVDKANRRWTIGAYAEMAGRTTVNRAFNDAGIWRMGQSSIHLVTVVRGLDSCRKCAEWAGKILSTDGTPAGPRTLPHATRDEAVTVNVAGTVEQARAAGWGHPNCRCRLVAYSPGLTIPQDDTTYDEDAEKERADQRALEREIRAAKRREASAMTDTDRRKAAQDVRDAQGDMRDFIRRTGRNRQSYREQLGFADGRGGFPRAENSSPLPPSRPSTVAYRAAKGTPVGDGARHAVSQMRAVHTIPSTVTPVSIARMPSATARAKPGVRGSYSRAQSTLWLRPDAEDLEFTTVHELGHWLDNKLLGDDARYGSDRLDSPAWTRWNAAVAASAPTRHLETVRGMVGNGRVSAELGTHIDYMLRPREQFARAYAQWVATRTGDATLLAQLAVFQGADNSILRAYHWADDDFEAIGAALDDIFRERGLLK